MPGFDRTGPQGKGPLTGRRRGFCRDIQTTQTEKTSEQSAENKEVIYGVGRGGRPRGGGRGNCYRGGRGFGRFRGRGYGN
jgi:hypothetical protein